ncbi:MAG: imidazole glycerol phosphate synthase cyclase subunit [Kiloniellales bacterium]
MPLAVARTRAAESGAVGLAPIRIIARLDIKGPNVIKGVHLEGLRVLGKPGEMARRYYAEGADEIVYMDVVASLYGRNNILSVVEEAARDIFVPMTVGGGIRTLEDIVSALRSGADKVAINTAATKCPEFLRDAAEAFGSQCIVLSVEAKRRGPGKWEALSDNGRERTGLDVLGWVVEAESLGVGEVLVTSVDMEGTRKGFDVELIASVRERVRVPVIACGGAGGADHVNRLLDGSHCDAVCCASIFHYDLCPIPDLKRKLSAEGQAVRL